MKNIFVLVLSLAIVFAVSCNAETEHKHSYVEKTVAPTCAEDGKTYKECSTCGDIIELEVIPARHSEDWVVVVDKEPTEEEKGTYIYICPNCKEIMDTVIRKLYPAEVFVPTDAKLEIMNESILSFMSGVIYQSTYPYAVNVVLSSHLVIDNAVFKENTIFQDNIETKTYTVKKGIISLIEESQKTADLPFTITITVNGTITQVITVDEKNYDVIMSFNNATFDNTKLVDEDAFSYEIESEASGISKETVLDEAWNLLYDLINTGKYLEVFSDCEIESQTTIEFKDKTNNELMYKSSTIHLCDEKGTKFERAYSKGMTKVGKEEEHNVAFGYSFPLNFDYIQIDGKFYDPEVLNRKLEEDRNSK